jgi:hypothetical protein
MTAFAAPRALARLLPWLLAFAVLSAGAMALRFAVQAVYDRGVAAGRTQCQASVATATVQGQQQQAAQVLAQATADITHAQAAGRVREVERVRIQTVFQVIEKEARHAPPDPVDSCVLPDDRLRLWAAANAGALEPLAPGAGAPGAQPDAGPAAAAPAGIGPDAGPGGQPPPGGDAVPLAGQPDVQPAAAPAHAP